MNKLLSLLCIIILLLGCKYENTSSANAKVQVEETISNYPTEMTAVFDAHGGIDSWNNMNNLCFTIDKTPQETHTIDLKSRRTRIETPDYLLGFDGEKVWIEQDSIALNPERARFYHNLMFYFYAMPFVLADDGIIYEQALPLQMDGLSYPGTKISFKENVGDAPDDTYIIYRHPETNQMEWLAYTVTYGGKGPSSKYNFIRYSRWEKVNDLLLPSELQWYKTENGVPTELRNTVSFKDPSATTTKLATKLFTRPEHGVFVE